jgi:XRE family transcriptional regulator, aerobic/anaerobic benzoate catabolism transcriptional regulator
LNDRINEVDAAAASGLDERSPVLDAFAERLRNLRAQRGITRKALAEIASVSERYLGNLETGRGNPSLLILLDIARALQCSTAELIGDVTTSNPEWLMIRELLDGRSIEELRRARLAVGAAIGVGGSDPQISGRIALIGLRGAGKSTLGRMLAEDLDVPFVELSTEIERVAGLSIREIHDLYGQSAYRRYERRALEETLQIYPELVLATPGGMVSEPATLNMLLSHCLTVWLRASPEDHMKRVMQQGDLRPMAGNTEAMEDLRRILESRSAFYGKADLTLDTSEQALDATFARLRTMVRERRALTTA